MLNSMSEKRLHLDISSWDLRIPNIKKRAKNQKSKNRNTKKMSKVGKPISESM